MTNLKKVIITLVIVVLAGLGVYSINAFMPKGVEGDKTVTIVLEDHTAEKTKVVYEKKLHTSSKTLADLLAETKELKVVTEESQYGKFVTSLYGIKQGDMAKGPWWLYESENNPTCKQAGYCPGITEVPLQDNDKFVFKFTDKMQ